MGVGMPELEADVDADEPDSAKIRLESRKLPPPMLVVDAPLLLLYLLVLQLLLLLLLLADAAAAAVARLVLRNNFVLYSSHLSFSMRAELRERLLLLLPRLKFCCSSLLLLPVVMAMLSWFVSRVEGGGGVEECELLKLQL